MTSEGLNLLPPERKNEIELSFNFGDKVRIITDADSRIWEVRGIQPPAENEPEKIVLYPAKGKLAHRREVLASQLEKI